MNTVEYRFQITLKKYTTAKKNFFYNKILGASIQGSDKALFMARLVCHNCLSNIMGRVACDYNHSN